MVSRYKVMALVKAPGRLFEAPITACCGISGSRDDLDPTQRVNVRLHSSVDRDELVMLSLLRASKRSESCARVYDVAVAGSRTPSKQNGKGVARREETRRRRRGWMGL